MYRLVRLNVSESSGCEVQAMQNDHQKCIPDGFCTGL